MKISFSLMLFLLSLNLFLLGIKVSRLLNFLMFSELFLLKFLLVLKFNKKIFEVGIGSCILVLGACETSIGFTILVKTLRIFKKEVFRLSNSQLCEGF